MPTYLCHGFRWHRMSIRIFIVIHDIDDAAPEWIIAPASSRAILDTFHRSFDFLPERGAGSRPATEGGSGGRKGEGERPGGKGEGEGPGGKGEGEEPGGEQGGQGRLEVVGDGEAAVSLLEEYDPADLETVSRPYAYVADYVARVDSSAGVGAEMAAYEERAARAGAGWFPMLRDQLQEGEEIGWYVVVCGDEERETGLPPFVPEPEDEEVGGGEGEGAEEKRGEGGGEAGAGQAVESRPGRLAPETPAPGPERKKPDKKRSFRRLFGMKDTAG